MDNIQIIELEGFNGEMIEYAIIDRGNGEFTSMLKSDYDAKQEAIANFVFPNPPVLEETAPVEEAPIEEVVEETPVEEETI